MYTFGAIPSPFDARDYSITARAEAPAEMPSEFELWQPPVSDQGTTASCVAHSAAAIKDTIEYYQNGVYRDYSAGFIYGYRPEGYYQGSGMITREALETLRKVGDVLSSDFETDREVDQARKLVMGNIGELAARAYPWRISEYYRIRTGEEAKTALFSLKSPILAVIPVYQCFCNPGADGYVAADKSGEIKGYHAVVIYGWNQRGWKIQNSWGPDWGAGGRGVLDYGYEPSEMWAVADSILNKRTVVLRIGSTRYTVDGVEREMDTPPFVKDDRTFVPVYFVAQALGDTVAWDGTARTVTITRTKWQV